MTSRSRTIADALKTISTRPRATVPDPLPDGSEDEPVLSAPKAAKVEQEEPRPRARGGSLFSPASSGSGAEDLIARLSRLHTSSDRKRTEESTHSEESEPEETHRATSRTRGKRYDTDDESPPRRRKADPPARRGRQDRARDESSGSEPEERPTRHRTRRDDESPEDRQPTRRTTRPAAEKVDRRSARHERDEEERSDEEEERRDSRGRGGRAHQGRDRDEERSDEEEEDVPRRSRGKSGGAPGSFSSLPKTAIARIAKTVGVSSLGADIYVTVRDLAGAFVNGVVADAARKAKTSVLSSADLEPYVEKYLGHTPEDLEKSDINMSTFTRWLKEVSEKNRVTIKKEAGLYLNNATEYYVITLFFNANDAARHAMRSRVTSKDLEMASRM